MPNTVILHVDLDYFYAQVEELRHPELKGRPLAVCMFSGRTETSGAVATANYKARGLGVKSGMPIAFAKKAAPNTAFLPADREHYEQVSERIMGILRSLADRFEQVSIDEAYLDISQRSQGSYAEAKKIAKEAKARVLEEEKLTCSIGMGPNKLIAKMASGQKKPDGLTAVAPSQVKEFLRSKRIQDIHGIGEKTLETLSQNGIKTIPELAAAPTQKLQELFGENRGMAIHYKALGIDDSPVEEKPAQQFSRIMTLKEDATSPEKLELESSQLAAELSKRATEEKVHFKTVGIILISSKLETVTRSTTLQAASQRAEDITKAAGSLINTFYTENGGYECRRFGLRISNFQEPGSQKKLSEFA